MFAEGQGVRRDPIAACALARMAVIAAESPDPEHPFAYLVRIDEAQRFMRMYCEPLTAQDVITATRSLGCFAFGMPEDVLTIGDRSVWVGRAGIGLTEAIDGRAPLDVDCPQVVVRLRPLTLEPPADAAPVSRRGTLWS
jgi:hypothetical protein